MQSTKANVLLMGGKEGSVKLILTRLGAFGTVLLPVIVHRPLQSLKLRSAAYLGVPFLC